jgi:hypothetical protein
VAVPQLDGVIGSESGACLLQHHRRNDHGAARRDRRIAGKCERLRWRRADGSRRSRADALLRTSKKGLTPIGFTCLRAAVQSGRTDCKTSHHAKDADLAALVAAGHGDVPLVQMKWCCGNCGSRMTEFIVGGSHMRPR